ncbi:GIY-YIG nuclease family protein [Novosphingobium piscinae]|uniref:GIY-YIG nuclease family protein n=1 Tax=Novosphingobium piscinae TaxID=1507448 RepID=A0A7X1KRA2_9SPHN|nr:GIY-YIG nuclease family protein [Novosphingobium piscinae]MBC2670423.1 GIY-YIG nuclease family protein [Novosphingobium piscinae]
MGGWVYIMTNGPHGTLYIGVTAHLAARVHQHRTGSGSEFCRKHGLTRLVYAERHERIDEAIACEKAMKRWKRSWKLCLVREANPHWEDLFERMNA